MRNGFGLRGSPAPVGLGAALGRRSVLCDAESGVAGGAVGFASVAGVDAVAAAVGGVTKVGASAHHALCAADRSGGVLERAVGVVAGVEPVGAPLPDVAGDVKQTEVVGWVRVHWCSPGEAVGAGVLAGEPALE